MFLEYSYKIHIKLIMMSMKNYDNECSLKERLTEKHVTIHTYKHILAIVMQSVPKIFCQTSLNHI
jgi:hypothetical protein